MMMLPRWGGLSGSAVAYTESDAATQLESGLTVADTDDDNLEKAIVRISAGFATGEDVLAATVGSTGLTATYTASGNVRDYGNWYEGPISGSAAYGDV